ncbi:synaptobrevin-domain-containing protein [Ampelomyces quisqualis]|uniref:Synaptobrevin homolog YKT6 n=1 Tax=Ampelomyces quisqualis TaxID=50730 RepID=A0A6A5QVP1_AMPQU|nr:synaptobrevin-domain-containing protein [Ampelomyces quisqualis]
MTRPVRGSIPSFRSPRADTATQHPPAEHSTLLSRGLISPTKKPPASPPPTERDGGLRPAMASSSTATPLLSACIAHTTTVLAEHTASASSNASSLVSVVLPSLDHQPPARRTIDQNKHFIHCLIKSPSDFSASHAGAGGLTFLVIAERELGQRIPFGFLANLEKKFFAEFDAAETDFAHLPPYGCASFNGALKRLMAEQGGTYAGQQDALRTAQKEIDGVREIMTENIERVLERGEHMNVLVDKTGRLGENARDFRVRSRTLKRSMWWKNVKLMVLLCLVVIFLIYLFVGFGCGLPAWGRCLRH